MFLNIYKAVKQQEKQPGASTSATTIYDFAVKDAFYNDVCLEKYRGFVVLIINVASRCQLAAKNYATIMELDHKYRAKGLRILSFPCNQFENGMPEEVDQYLQYLKASHVNVGEVMQKVNVNGEHEAPLFKYLKSRQKGFFGNTIKWNFTKFLVDRNGIPVSRFSPNATITTIETQIAKLL